MQEIEFTFFHGVQCDDGRLLCSEKDDAIAGNLVIVILDAIKRFVKTEDRKRPRGFFKTQVLQVCACGDLPGVEMLGQGINIKDVLFFRTIPDDVDKAIVPVKLGLVCWIVIRHT